MAAHPRSRGEHSGLFVVIVMSAGSSPLARGTQNGARERETSSRLIPARAGNTWFNSPRIIFPPAHPRSRGEHVSVTVWKPRASGSSPLARGTLTDNGGVFTKCRLIPARAGNTFRFGSARSSLPAHPRSRGEHKMWAGSPLRVSGSSPLARGTPGWTLPRSRMLRLIPARAGNTSWTRARPSSVAAHPRSRGEHLRLSRIPS